MRTSRPPRPIERALRPGAALVLAAFAWLGAASAAAAAGVVVDLQLEVYVNGVDKELLAAFQQASDGSLRAPKSELAELGFATEKLPTGADGLVRLDQVPGLAVRYDAASQSIYLTVAATALATTQVDGHPGPKAPAPSPTPWGAVLNYTLYGSASPAAGNFLASPDVSAELEGRVFGPLGVLSTAVAARATQGAGAVRLQSTWTYEDPQRLLRYQAGDIVSSGLSWSRPVFLGGVQWSRSFELKPDLVTTAVPTLTGTALTPSALDLYVDNVKALSTQVPAGPFQINQAPLTYGAGDARIVVTDVLGRQTRTDVPFYASESLLAPGLLDFSLEAGFARRDFGVASDDYDPRLAGSGSIRYGLSSAVTLQGHFEAVDGLADAGGGAAVGIGRLGVVSAVGAVSANRQGTGGLFDASFESRQSRFTFTARLQRTFGDYEDIASWTAERAPGQPIPAEYRPPSAIDQVVVSAPLWSQSATASLSFAQVVSGDQRSEIAGLFLSQSFKRVTVTFNAFDDFATRNSQAVTLGVSLALGHRIYGSATVVAGPSGATAVEEAASPGVQAPGDIAWRAQLAEGRQNSGAGAVDYMAPFAALEAGLQAQPGSVSAFGQAAGSIAFLDGHAFLSRRIDSAFAVVDAGVSGVGVDYENRFAGATGAAGRLLVPNLNPYQANQIDIDPGRLPVDEDPAVTHFVVAPRSGAGVVIRLAKTTEGRSALVTFVDALGHPIAVGSSGQIEGGGEGFLVGYDGQAFIPDLSPQNVVHIALPDGETCRAAFAFSPKPGTQVRLPPAICAKSGAP